MALQYFHQFTNPALTVCLVPPQRRNLDRRPFLTSAFGPFLSRKNTNNNSHVRELSSVGSAISNSESIVGEQSCVTNLLAKMTCPMSS